MNSAQSSAFSKYFKTKQAKLKPKGKLIGLSSLLNINLLLE